MSEARCVYAIVPATTAVPEGLRGFADARLERIVTGSIAAICSVHDGSAIAPSRERVAIHDAVVAALETGGVVLPMDYGTVAASEQAVNALLEQRRPTIQELLTRLDGCVEMGLRLAWDVVDIAAHLAERHACIAACRRRMLCADATGRESSGSASPQAAASDASRADARTVDATAIDVAATDEPAAATRDRPSPSPSPSSSPSSSSSSSSSPSSSPSSSSSSPSPSPSPTPSAASPLPAARAGGSSSGMLPRSSGDLAELEQLIERALIGERAEHERVIRRLLGTAAREIHVRPTREPHQIIDFAVLISGDAVDAFEDAVHAAAERFDESYVFDLTGPWAPRHFVAGELAVGVAA
ncbi:MAG: GvpL/GvpF family gas vesicle protein [Phycisphaerales bacterium]